VTVLGSLVAAPITLDQLAALSDELAALARSGVPLDRGLTALSRDMPGKLGSLSSDLAMRLSSGQPLDRAVTDQLGASLPPEYRAVITAGLRAGRLPAALEGISHTARLISQLRNSVGLSLLYPSVVLVLTWVLGLFVTTSIAPLMLHMLGDFDVISPRAQATFEQILPMLPVCGFLIPLAFGGWLAWVWNRSGRVAAGIELHPLLSFGAVGNLARMQRASRCASVAELLGLMLQHDVPLAEAVELASAAVGSPALAAGGKVLAERLTRGETIRDVPKGFPPLLAWMLASGLPQAQLCRSLARSAEVYREEVARRSQWLMLYVPLVLTIVISGGVVLIYALLTLGPWLAILRRLTQPHFSSFF
jgi:general secretion pathway protein F